LAFGVTYASVPLYRAFCGATGFGGIPVTDSSKYTPDRLYPDDDADKRGRITVHFEATASDDLKWKFTPQQRFVKVLPGETALAFYTAENWGKEDVVGIATYNITPSRVSTRSMAHFTTNISDALGLISVASRNNFTSPGLALFRQG